MNSNLIKKTDKNTKNVVQKNPDPKTKAVTILLPSGP